jgi:uncharacterized repeat protein (TIGR03803 family)
MGQLATRKFACAGLPVLLAALLAGCGGGSSPSNPPPSAPPPTTIYAFGGPGSPAGDGAEPKGSLTAVVVGGKPVLFGRTAIGGNGECGIIFSVSPDGSNYQVLYRFNGPDGCDPRHDAMTFDPATGAFYSTTQGVQQNPPMQSYGNQGQIFTFSPMAPIPTPIPAIVVFQGPPGGAQQHSSFSIDPVTGMLYGMTAQGGGANSDGLLYAVKPDGTGFVALHDFTKAEGRNPHGRIVLDAGVLYGITRSDGTPPGGGSGSGFGAVFSYALTAPLANGPITVLHTFAGGPSDGATSDHGYLTPVDVGGKRIFFGLTQCGGTGGGVDACSASSGGGDGIIFQIDPSAPPGSAAAFNIVHSFQGTEHGDGADPYGSLMYDGTYLYGTTSAGGTHDNGTVFRFTPVPFGNTAVPQILYNFGDAPDDGAKPIDNVILVNGMLYGMSVYGGAAVASKDSPSETGWGAIFRIPIPPQSGPIP